MKRKIERQEIPLPLLLKMREESEIPERLIPTPDDQSQFLEHLDRYRFIVPYVKGKRVLDVGCGVGYGTAYLSCYGASLTVGLDISIEALNYAISNYSRRNVCHALMDCKKLSLRSGAFDVVCSFEVVEHLEDPRKYLEEIVRVLKPGGILFISTPNRPYISPGLSIPLNRYHIKEYCLEEFESLLGEYFTDIEIYGQFLSERLRRMEMELGNDPFSRIIGFFDQMGFRRLRLAINKKRKMKLKLLLKQLNWGLNIPVVTDVGIGDYLISKTNPREAKAFLAICKNNN